MKTMTAGLVTLWVRYPDAKISRVTMKPEGAALRSEKKNDTGSRAGHVQDSSDGHHGYLLGISHEHGPGATLTERH